MEKRSILFRKKSLDRISEPDQLTDYLRVTKPVVWLVLAAITVLLAGLIVWSFAGTVDITVSGDANVQDGEARVMLADNRKYELDPGMKVIIDGEEITITAVDMNEFGKPVGHSQITRTDGLYPASVVVRSTSPFRLLFGE